MKKAFAFIVVAIMLVTTVVGLAACSPDLGIVVWVGSESVEFYQRELNQYIVDYNSAHEEAFPYIITVQKSDTGTAAGAFLQDQEAGADIFTVAHDNLSRLTSGASAIGKIESASLIAQIQADNSDEYIDVVSKLVSGERTFYGVPQMSQTLMLFYNKTLVTETQAASFEGLQQAAAAKGSNVQAASFTGEDGYNFSCFLLARTNDTKETTLKLYEDRSAANSDCTGDDTVAIMQWCQRTFAAANGLKFPTESGWETEMKNGNSCAVIGGAWNYNAAVTAVGGEANLGIAMLPTFTLTAADVAGTTIAANTVYRAGTFADTKMLVKKKVPTGTKAQYLDGIMEFLSSKEMQEKSFEECANPPAYKNALTEFDAIATGTSLTAQMVRTQVQMADYGIPQPFGFGTLFNPNYYSGGGPALFRAIIENKTANYDTTAKIKAELANISHIWQTGNQLAK